MQNATLDIMERNVNIIAVPFVKSQATVITSLDFVRKGVKMACKEMIAHRVSCIMLA